MYVANSYKRGSSTSRSQKCLGRIVTHHNYSLCIIIHVEAN